MQFLKNDLTFIYRIVCIYRKNLVSYKIALINYRVHAKSL